MSKSKRHANQEYGAFGSKPESEMGDVADTTVPARKPKAPRDVCYWLRGVSKSTGISETVKTGRTIGEIRQLWRTAREMLDNTYSSFTLVRCKAVDISALDKVIKRARREGGNSVPEVPKTVA